MMIRSVILSEAGNTRSVNEDVCYADDARQLYIIADGMGGSSVGGIAGTIVVSTVSSAFRNESENMPRTLRAALNAANAALLEKAKSAKKFSGLAAAALVVKITRQSLAAGYIGNCRLYVYRGRKLHRLTRDHTTMQDMIDGNMITERAALASSFSNYVIRCLGVESGEPASVATWQLRRRDKILLTTDGLHSVLNDDEIESAFRNYKHSNVILDALREAIAERGAPDNFSALIAEQLR